MVVVDEDHPATTSYFYSFDQNWSKINVCEVVKHTYKNVFGVLRPKKDIMANDDALKTCLLDREKFWKERDALLALIPATDIDNATKVIGGYKSSVTQAQNEAGNYKAEVENREEQVGKLKERVSELETKLKTSMDEAKANWDKYDAEGKAKGELNKQLQTLQLQYDNLKQQVLNQSITLTFKDLFKMILNQKITITKGS
jgi:chromosome segregation ATPase